MQEPNRQQRPGHPQLGPRRTGMTRRRVIEEFGGCPPGRAAVVTVRVGFARVEESPGHRARRTSWNLAPV